MTFFSLALYSFATVAETHNPVPGQAFSTAHSSIATTAPNYSHATTSFHERGANISAQVYRQGASNRYGAETVGLRPKYTLEDLFRMSEYAVIGKAVDYSSFWLEGRTWTKVAFMVDELVAGDWLPSQIDVLLLGGNVGDVGQQTSDHIYIPPDRRVMLFLDRWLSKPGSYYGVVGGQQGVILLDG